MSFNLIEFLEESIHALPALFSLSPHSHHRYPHHHHTVDQSGTVLSTRIHVPLSFSINGLTATGVSMSIIARIDQKIDFSPAFQDAGGNPVAAADLGSVPAWSVSDANIATVSASADGMTATVTPTGKLGTVQVNMVVDADPSEGVEEINGTAEITFKAGKATFVTLSSTVGDQTAHAPVIPVVATTDQTASADTSGTAAADPAVATGATDTATAPPDGTAPSA